MNDDEHNYCPRCGAQLHDDQAHGTTCDTCVAEAKRGSVKARTPVDCMIDAFKALAGEPSEEAKAFADKIAQYDDYAAGLEDDHE